MRKQIFIILLIFFLMVSCGCFTTTAQVKIIKNGIELNTGKINLKAQFYSANIVRIIKWSPGGTSEKLSLSSGDHNERKSRNDESVEASPGSGARVMASGRKNWQEPSDYRTPYT